MRSNRSPTAKKYARLRWLRRNHPFPRFTFDAAWQSAVDTLTHPVWTFLGRGTFILYAAGDVEIRLPDCRVYRGKLKRHVSKGRPWYVGFVVCQDHDRAARDERLNAEGAVPTVKPAYFDLWPLQVKVSPAPRSGDYLGLMWVSTLDERPGGEVFRVVAGMRESDVFLNGYVVPYRPKG